MKFNYIIRTAIGDYLATVVSGEGVFTGSSLKDMVGGKVSRPHKVSLHCDYIVEENVVECPVEFETVRAWS